MKEIILQKKTHGFFDELVSYFASICALGTSLELQNRGIAQPWLPNQHLTLEGMKSVTNCTIRFYPHAMLNTISNNRWPEEINLQEIPLESEPINHPINLTSIQMIHGSMIQSAFIHYFESYRVKVESKFGKEPIKWPEIWNFARVIRNAFAHGGKIKFDNQKSPKVNWKSLEYDPKSNGKNILYKDITPVEVIYLMEEMDRARR